MHSGVGQNKGIGFYDWQKMTISVTSRCNLRCKMCGWTQGDTNTLPEETAMHCADFAQRQGFREVEVGGGEPTLVDYFWRLLDRLSLIPQAEIKVTTNAVTLTEEEIEALAGYPDLNLQVSIDGIGETHDHIRGVAGAFERSAENLERLAAAGCRKLSINTVVQRTNLADMSRVYARFKHLPLQFHAFSLIEGQEFCREQVFEPYEHPQVERALREVMRQGQADGRDVILSESLLRAFVRRVRHPLFLMHPGAGCSVLRKSLIIGPTGYVVPCFHFPWPEYEARRLGERTLDDIVAAPEVREELANTLAGQGCQGCSTMCYNWDEEFRLKVMQPSGRYKLRQLLLCGREYIRERFPWLVPILRRVKHLLGLPNPPGYSLPAK